MWRICAVESSEIIEELERLQTEFGKGRCQVPDTLENAWWYDIDHIQFDPVTQTYRFVPAG
jgi:hypothetical protein